METNASRAAAMLLQGYGVDDVQVDTGCSYEQIARIAGYHGLEQVAKIARSREEAWRPIGDVAADIVAAGAKGMDRK